MIPKRNRNTGALSETKAKRMTWIVVRVRDGVILAGNPTQEGALLTATRYGGGVEVRRGTRGRA
jgi:hypothetical protein